MYSILRLGNHQYRVRPGEVIDVEKLDSPVGNDLTFDQVLFVGGDNPVVGAPLVQGASVKARVIRQAKDRKILVFKRRPGLWDKKRGHRQNFTSLLITEISDGSGGSAAIDKKSKLAEKHLK